MTPIKRSYGIINILWIGSASASWYTMSLNLAPTSTPMRACESDITSCFQ